MPEAKEKSTILEQITARVKALFAEAPEEKEVTEMAEATVKDTGIIIKAESWEVGKIVTTVTEEGDELPMPEGTYELEDGTILTTDANGSILEIVMPEEVVEEAKEESKEKEEMSYVTKEEFTAGMSEMLKALERVSTMLSATPKEEKPTEKVEAENKLLKQRLAEKRKAVADKAAEKKNDPLPEKFGKTNRGHISGAKERVAKRFKDFDFKVEKVREDIELN